MPNPEKRFWAKVDKTGECWVYTSRCNDDGYGIFYPERKTYCAAHRYSWSLVNGPIPSGMNVLHHCDNPPCVRPEHLFLGTQKDNVADMARKGRHRNSLDRSLIGPVFRLRSEGLTQKAIGEVVGLSQSCVSNILKGVR